MRISLKLVMVLSICVLSRRGVLLSQGVTFRVEKDDLVIARILHGAMIDRQGLLHVGDIIKEVNGRDVGNNPTELQEMLKDCSGGITLKILPSYRDAPAPPQVHAHAQKR